MVSMNVPTYLDHKLSELDPEVMATMTGEFGVVVIRNSGATPEEYAECLLV